MAENWIQGANIKKGAFTAKANAAGMGVQEYARKMQNAPGVTGRQARLALTFAGMARSSGRKAVTDRLKKKG
jgi:hypothetical protein